MTDPVEYVETIQSVNAEHTHKPTVVPTNVPSTTPMKAFDALIWVSSGHKAKQQKQDPLAFGPLPLDTLLSWPGFLPYLVTSCHHTYISLPFTRTFIPECSIIT